MTGHPLLISQKVNRPLLAIEDRIFEIELSFYKYNQIDGYFVGLKFSDETGSMDSSKRGNFNAYSLGRAIGRRAVSMLRPDINNITLLGFYLLTEDLSARGERAVSAKARQYSFQARQIQSSFDNKFPFINQLEAKGGLGWAMSEYPFESYENFKQFESELAKTVSVLPCG